MHSGAHLGNIRQTYRRTLWTEDRELGRLRAELDQARPQGAATLCRPRLISREMDCVGVEV